MTLLDPSGPPADPDAVVTGIVREEYPRVLATLVRVTGDLTDAEDAVAEALARAWAAWPREGLPDQPRAWLITTARRVWLDQVRRESKRAGKEQLAMVVPEDPTPLAVQDDLLRLLFTCCHPSLAPETQVALALRVLLGLDSAEVARALLVTEAALARRVTRAKQKIRVAAIPYRVPDAADLPDRVAGVLATVYLLFNEGYASSSGGLVRPLLLEEALRLGRLVHELMPDDAGAVGLLALMLLHDARRTTRTSADGRALRLHEQDRSQWDAGQIRAGVELVGEGLRRTPSHPDRYVVQAAIAACHALAASYEETDWDAVISWYDVLLTVEPSPAARLGRASAVAERDGAAAALAELERIDGVAHHAWWHGARAELLLRLGQDQDAAASLARARDLGLPAEVAARLGESPLPE